jgi:hypothetical protein
VFAVTNARATLILVTLSLLVLVATSACRDVPQSHGGPVRDHVSFVDSLRAKGYAVDPVSDVTRPFLRPRGTLLRISGAGLSAPVEVESYNYDERDLGIDGRAAAERDAVGIGSDGQPRTGPVAWPAPPHFLRRERVLVLYLGNDPKLIAVLTDLLGPQFAGS